MSVPPVPECEVIEALKGEAVAHPDFRKVAFHPAFVDIDGDDVFSWKKFGLSESELLRRRNAKNVDIEKCGIQYGVVYDVESGLREPSPSHDGFWQSDLANISIPKASWANDRSILVEANLMMDMMCGMTPSLPFRLIATETGWDVEWLDH